jgi:hypothetical protein
MEELEEKRFVDVGFDMALCVLRAGGKVSRSRRQDFLSMKNGRIYITPIAGAVTIWQPAQEDLLAWDWLIVR